MMRQLKNIGITTLMPYLCHFWKSDKDGLYFKYTTWEDICRLYDFNEELRSFINLVTGKIEVALREQIAYQMEQSYGCHWQNDEYLFKEATEIILKDKERAIQCIYKELQKWASRYFGEDYRERSFREIKEKLTFGVLYRIYSHLKARKEKESIAKHFGIPSVNIFSSSVYALEEVRNCCSHPQCVWNKSFRITPDELYFSSDYQWIADRSMPRNKLYYILCLLNYFMQVLEPEFEFTKAVFRLLNKYKEVISLSKMGFSQNWETETMWERKINPA